MFYAIHEFPFKWYERGAILKVAFALILLVIPFLPALAQTTHSRTEIIEHFCRAPEVTNGPEIDRIKSIEARLGPVVGRLHGPRIHVAVIESEEINAHTITLNPSESLICIPIGIIRFMGESEGEMAFVFAHETGHALDRACKSSEGRAQITPPSLGGALNKILGGTGRDLLAEQRTCESRADTIGFAEFVAAGYNPYDAAGSFGRLMMYSGDTYTGLFARLVELGKDHPMTPDRISHMRALLNEQLQRGTTTQ